MKTFFQILFVLCLPFVGMAQGNLQFNQVRFIEKTSTILSDSFNIVVPIGKTWKIESITTGQKSYDAGTQTNVVSTVGTIVSLNDAVVHIRGDRSYLPVWLPAGTYVIRIYATTPYGCKTNLSVLEFNITP
jgi:hypothetical protein